MAQELLTSDPVFKELKTYFQNVGKNLKMNQLFAEDKDRFSKYSVKLNFPDGPLLFDYSKNIFDEKMFELLIKLAKSRNIEKKRDEMIKGGKINSTEGRSVLHTALRSSTEESLNVDGVNIIPEITKVLEKIKNFSDKIRNGEIKGFTGEKFTDIVNIGIGGSDLGPVMVTEALKPYSGNSQNENETGNKNKEIKVHFVSNVDGSHVTEVLKKIQPQNTLFIIASKTFTTQETLLNAETAKEWLLDSFNNNKESVAKHFVALSTNKEKVKEFGINEENMFVFWDWVGGRYSLWSSIGLSIAIYIGFNNYKELLEGASYMDKHFQDTPLDQNIPVIMGLLGIIYNNLYESQSHAILPYDQYLHRLPAYLQQLDMESNGKHVTKDNKLVNYSTGPIIWGEPGTNGQHAFYQLIHQGTKLIPCDFLAGISSHNPIRNNIHQEIFLSNFLAQTEALMKGKTKEEVINELKKEGKSENDINNIVEHKIFEGNRPTNSILYKKLTPFTLGVIIAMYEHKVFVQGGIWNINSFDQWGVELGKQLAKIIYKDLKSSEIITTHDGSTNGLISFIKSN